jgi:F420-dependent oxidoreductase-like protein
MIRLGLQIPNFTYPGVAPSELFERVSDVAVAAEGAGFDTVMVMDHFYQLPLLGPPEDEMLEGYTTLAALAARTERVNLGTLVTGVTYRNPAILAKTVTTVDVISKGRAFLGIGAAWFDLEHEGLGVDFPRTAERFERLEEAIEICTAMFRDERPTFDGKHYRVKGAINSPAPIRGDIPLMVGGAGERRTLPLAARYAQMSNFNCGFDEIPHKLEVLERHLADAGRARSDINVSSLGSVVLGDTMEDAEAKRNAFLAARGLDWDSLGEAGQAMVAARLVVGDEDAVGEQLQAWVGTGLDGITVNFPSDGHDPHHVAQAGEILARALA